MSEQDDIRAKRVARLQRLAALNAASEQSAGGQEGGKSSPSVSKSVNPASKVIKPMESEVSHKVEAPKSSAKPTPPPKDAKLLLKSWINSDVAELLQSSFEPQENGRTFVESSYSELSRFNDNDYIGYVDLFLKDDLIDRIFLENLTEIGRPSPLMYLFEVWGSAQTALRKVNNQIALRKTSIKPYQKELLDNQKYILKEIVRLATSYGLIAFQVPDMFVNNDLNKATGYFVDNIQNVNFIEFCLAAVEQAKQQDALLEILDIWCPALHNQLVKHDITDLSDSRYIAVLNFYLLLLNDKEIASVFTQVLLFRIGKDDALGAEKRSLLGSILRVAPIGAKESLRLYDRSDGQKNKYQIAQIQQSVQGQHKNLVNTYLFPIIDKIIRGGERSRNDLLAYFSTIINANHLRVATQPDYSRLSSHGLIINITLVLIKLSMPFLRTDFKKLDKIDIGYFNKNKLLDISEETRISSTIKEADKYYLETRSDKTANFISDCYFLTLTYVHFGIGGLSLMETKTVDLTKHLEDRVKLLKEQKQHMSAANNAVFDRMATLQIEKIERQLNLLHCEEDSFHCFFLNDEFQQEVFDFVSSSCVFLTRVIDPSHKYPATPLQIPLIPDNAILENVDNTDALRDKSPKPFRYYPEYAVESIISYITYIVRYLKNPLQSNRLRLNYFIEFAVVLLRCPELISNPHLKGKLVECLFYGSVSTSQSDYTPEFMIELFTSNNVVLSHMLYALLDFYVMVEKTGASSQFYDKFNSRYHISVIIEKLWQIPHYQDQLKLYSEKHEEFFIRFVARMLNDTTYLLDESLRELSSIHHLSIEVEKRTQSGNIDTAISSEFEGVPFKELSNRLSGAERHARSFIGLSNKTIELFDLFTKEVPSAFTKPEIVDRLAGMLDYNLNQLVGPRYGELKVKNPEKYQFNPRKLLTDISKIFANLSKEHAFAVAVSRDGRSFKKELFYKAQSILAKYGQLDSTSLQVLTDFAEKADAIRIEEEEEELELGDDIPDEFLDPLMFTLMVDPVILPSSKISIDRSTIKAHLLSDATDPFNRMPLKLEDVVPDDELKAKIEAFKLQKKKERLDNDVVMKD